MIAIIDYRGKTPTKTSSGIPLITAKIVKNGRILPADEFIAVSDYDSWMRRGIPLPNDIVITTEAPLGEVAQLDSRKVALAQRLIALRGKPDVLNNTFLKFLMMSPSVQEEMRARSTGTTVLGIKQSELRKVILKVPPLPEQEIIADILGSLDDKIELNRKMNETLEEMARAIFKSWFVDFDPVVAKSDGRQPEGMDAETAKLFPDSFVDSEIGRIPKGWRIAKASEVAETNAQTLSKSDDITRVEYIEISEVNRGDISNIQIFERGQEPSRARRRLRHGDTVLSTVRPDRRSYFISLSPSPDLIASTGFAVFSPTKVPWSFFYAGLTQDEVFEYLGQHADGGAYPAVRPEIIGQWSFAIPENTSILDSFHGLCSSLFSTADNNRKQALQLGQIRDSLLPKLLSGEIRVRTAL
jgi:type I restriction enzyme S subunit